MRHAAPLARTLGAAALVAALAAASFAALPARAAADAAVPWQFIVRADAADPAAAADANNAQPRCAPEAAGRCRDDLSLPQVFDVLARMAASRQPQGFTAPAAAPAAGGVDVLLGAGHFRLTQPLRLGAWPASALGPLRVSGAGAAGTVISGARAVPAAAWQALANSPQGPGGAEADARLPAVARPHVRVASLAGLLPPPRGDARRVSGFGEAIAPVAMELSAAGRVQTLARWPNAGWAAAEPLAAAAPGAEPSPRGLRIRQGRAGAWQAEPALVVAGYFSHDWAFERIPVDSVSAASGELRLPAPGARFGVRAGQRVFVENALSELDSPGEWYADAATQRLYFWPPDAAALATAEVSAAPQLLVLDNVGDVTVQNLTLQGSIGTAVSILNSQRVTLADAVVRNTGNLGVIIDGGNAVTLRRVALHDLGEGGVVVSGGDRRSLAPSGHVVEGCRIERFARLSRSYRPAIRIEGVGVQVLRNRIDDGPHSAIVFGGNEHRIEGNHISNVVTETNDAGAIYTGRDWTTRGTVIHNNLLQNIYPRLPGTVSVMGVYLDDQASGTTISGNVFANVTRAVFVGGGRDNTIDHNLFVASSPAIFADNRGTTWQREQTLDSRGTLRANLRNMPVNSDAYRSRYPRLADVLDDEPGRSKGNRASGNLFVASKEFEFLDGAQLGMAQDGNRTQPWAIFKTLRGPKAGYLPEDFEFAAPGFPDRAGYFTSAAPQAVPAP